MERGKEETQVAEAVRARSTITANDSVETFC